MAKATIRELDHSRHHHPEREESAMPNASERRTDRGLDGSEDEGTAERGRLASPEEFFARLTARADFREFHRRLADR